MSQSENTEQHVILESQGNYSSALQVGMRHQQQGRLQQAEAIYRQILEKQPSHSDATHLLGVIAYQVAQYDLAEKLINRAIALQPNFPDAHYNLGLTLRELKKIEEAINSFTKAILLNPNDAEAHLDLAFALLLQGDFEHGLVEYEWRWQTPEFTPRSFAAPLWDGSNLSGRTILIHAEQGLGDTIQFSRYIPLVAEQGGKVIVECQSALTRLLQTMSSFGSIVSRGSILPAFDVHCPLLSLPKFLQTRLDRIPSQIPYLSALSSAAVTGIFSKTELKVGIAWASGYYSQPKAFRNYQSKSCSLKLFIQFLSIPEVSLYSLQIGKDAVEINDYICEARLRDLSSQLNDFADTAAAIAQLDLIISVDTAVAHLAGAMGKPTWVLLPFVPDWRWLLEREDSPWYPTMRLFRQQQHGDWHGVFSEVFKALQDMKN